MTIASDPSTSLPEWPELRHQRKAIVVVDVVESVRLMQANEADVIDRWRRFVNEIRTQVLPAHGGRLVKSLGDGLLLEFESVQAAVNAALNIQGRAAALSANHGAASAMYLRIGAHIADVVVDDLDLYGSGVNLAARLTALASPGEVIVSAEARDHLTDGVGSAIHDLGDCFLKHFDAPVRAYRVAEASGRPAPRDPAREELLPTVAVIPFRQSGGTAADGALGDALADDVIAALSRSSGLKVVARLSTCSLRGSTLSLSEVRSLVGATYVLSGSYWLTAGSLHLRAELSDTRDSRVLWADALDGKVADVFAGQDEVVPALVAQVSHHVIDTELQRARRLPISTLNDYTLYVGGVSMLHRLSTTDFQRAGDLLRYLHERHPRSAAPPSMLAKWHFFRMVQGWTDSVPREAAKARDCVRQALAADPDHSFALAINAWVTAHSEGDVDSARRQCADAIAANAQEPYGWLVMAVLNSYAFEARDAEAMALRAVELSPLDPSRFLFDVVVGASKLAGNKFDEAVTWARSSLRLNAMHLSSHRLLVIALWQGGRHAQAREAATELLRVHPGFRVDEYARRYPGRHFDHADDYMNALRGAGIPK